MYARGRRNPSWRSYSISNVRILRQYSTRRVGKVFVPNNKQGVFDGRVEMDSHADTFVAGRNCILMHYTERVCDVMPYSEEYEAKSDIPIVQVATGYTAANGQRFVLIINEALWMPDLENSLMNPNQLRHFGVEVQDNPFHRDPMVIRKDDEDDGNGFVACLKTQGTVIYFNTWTPTDSDLREFPHIQLTSSAEWNPNDIAFPGQSDADIQEIES